MNLNSLFSGKDQGIEKEEAFYTDLNQINKAHHKVSYRGMPMLKCPFDLVCYQMIISEIRPDLIIEIGTLKGGSALWLGDLLRSIGKGEIHSIDLTQQSHNPDVLNADNIRLYEGGWQAYDLQLTSGFEKIMVIDDGSHIYDDVIGAFKKFSPLVGQGLYYIVEDGIIDQLNIPKQKFGGGPLKALREILAEDPTFEVDHKWINFFGRNATFNPLGYLKKKPEA